MRLEQHMKEEIGEAINLELLIWVLPEGLGTWVRQHEPANGLTAAKLALQYLNAPVAHSMGAAPKSSLQIGQPGLAKRESLFAIIASN